MNKMILAVVPRDQADEVVEALVQAGHTATVDESRGGVLRQAQRLLFIAVDAADLDKVLGLIRTNCRTQVGIETAVSTRSTCGSQPPVTVELGGAVVFVWDLTQFAIF